MGAVYRGYTQRHVRDTRTTWQGLESIDISRGERSLASRRSTRPPVEPGRTSDTKDLHRLLWTGFLRSCEQFSTRWAIDVAGREVTTSKLAYLVKYLAAILQEGACGRRSSSDGSVRLPAPTGTYAVL